MRGITMKLDLWPTDLPSESITRTPVAILRQQATLLGNKTKNIVEARVKPPMITLPDKKFYYRFDIVAPCLGDYFYSLFTISHSIDFYPVQFDIGMAVLEDIAENLCCEVVDVEKIANTEDEFIEIIKTIFAANKTRVVIEAILAQSGE